MRRLAHGALVSLALTALGVACAPTSADLRVLSSPSDEIVWESAQRALKEKTWEPARQYLRRIVDAFPQSEHQADARLLVADTYFEEGGTASYILAASSYREFLTLYPQHPKSDYAQLRNAECYFRQRNKPDRDQTTTLKALEEFQRLLDIYPGSQYTEAAEGRVHECRQTLARSHHLVGFFYQRGRRAWGSAVGRYEIVLSEYPDYEKTDEVLYRISQCLAAAGRYAEALPYIGRLEKEFTTSRFRADAQKLRSTFPAGSTPALASPAPPASASPGSPIEGHAGQVPVKPHAESEPPTRPQVSL